MLIDAIVPATCNATLGITRVVSLLCNQILRSLHSQSTHDFTSSSLVTLSIFQATGRLYSFLVRLQLKPESPKNGVQPASYGRWTPEERRVLELSRELPLARQVNGEEIEATNTMAQRDESRDRDTDTMMDKKRYPADDDPMLYEAEWPGYWAEDGNNEPAPRRLSSATLGHNGTRAPW